MRRPLSLLVVAVALAVSASRVAADEAAKALIARASFSGEPEATAWARSPPAPR